MKKVSFMVVFLLSAFLFTACNQNMVSEKPMFSVEEPTAVPADHGSPPSQMVFYSFNELKDFTSLMEGNSEDLYDYYYNHTETLCCSGPKEAVAICSEKLDIRIPCADKFEDPSIEQIYMDSVNSCIDVWYHIGDYRYTFSCDPDINPDLEMSEDIRKEYEADNVLYRSETPDRIIYMYASNTYNPDCLYKGRIIMKDASIYIWILRDIDEDTGEYKDGGNPNVDLAQLEKFDFVIARDLLDQME